MKPINTCILATLLASAANAQSGPPRPTVATTPVAPAAGAAVSSAAQAVQSRPIATCELPPQPEAPPTEWPGGVVYFEFDANVSATEKSDMYQAMNDWNFSGANLAFVPRTVGVNANYIHILESSENSSYVGMIGGSQAVNIFNWNFEFIMAHELCHALGFWHEQSRWDRDTYVQIQTGNICCSAGGNFNIVASGDWPTTGTSYDFDSVMHYGQCDFSTCGTCTSGCHTIQVLAPNQSWQSLIGQRSHLSTNDVQDMRNAYGTGLAPAYVVPGYGSCVCGSIIDPYWDFAEVNANALAGSTIYFEAGTYNEPGVVTISKHMKIVPFEGVVTVL